MKLDRREVFRYVRSLLPVPALDFFGDELLSFDGFKTFENILAREILTTHIHTLETRVDVSEKIDIMCPSRFAEQFFGELLPHGLPSCAINDFEESNSLMKACTWLEGTELNTLITAREIEEYMMQDLPYDCWRFNKSLNEDILETYFNSLRELECLTMENSSEPQFHYALKPGSSATPLTRHGGCERGSSVQQTLPDDASFNLNIEKSTHHDPVKTFELKPWSKDPSLEQHSGLSILDAMKIDIQNLAGAVGESMVYGPTELLDFDTADFLLNKLQLRPNLAQHKIQAETSPLCIVDCWSLLDENSATSGVKTATKHAAMNQVKVLFELPEVLEDEYLGSLSDMKLGTYISARLLKPKPVKLEDVDSRDFAFEYFEKLLVLPQLALQTSSVHFLLEPTFIEERKPRIAEDVFQDLFQTEALPSPISASDWLYLDWHLSQVGHCNNYGCFHLQRRLLENELSMTSQKDMISGKRITDHQLLIGLTDDSLPCHLAETECHNDTIQYPAAKLHAPVSPSVLNFSNFTYTADKIEDKNYLDQSLLADEKRTPTRDQAPLAGSIPTSMDTVLSLTKQARQGVLSRDTKSTQASEIEHHHEVCQGILQSHDLPQEDCQILESASAANKFPRPNPSPSVGVDTASNYLCQTLNHVEPVLPEHLDTLARPSQDVLQIGFKPAPTLQLALEEMNPHQSDVDDFSQFSSGIGPHLVLVANILQPEGSILLQRRSSYQKILGLENEDLQVVEREMMLPVDLILNPSTCLTVYTKEKLLRNSKICDSNSEGFFSCVMDTIVDSHMKALSFSFQRWFMIFEGEMAFNSAVINILNKIYVCSAGFEMRVQGFVSTDPTTTDSLVVRCIKKMWRMSKRPFNSPMSEDLTDGEIYLATFPSLNPLSSHAILCLRIPIANFISWSPEEQNSALQGFDVRLESLYLLKSQALYGKLENLAHSQIFSQNSWPAASEIVAPEVGSHVNDAFSYFPPASEIGDCEVEEPARESAGEYPKDGYRNLSPPSCPDPNFQYHAAGQGISSCNGVPNGLCWPYDDYQPCVLPHHASGPDKRPKRLEENYADGNPVDVQSILRQFIRRRMDGGKDLKHFEREPDLFCDSFKILSNESYNARSCPSKSPPIAEYAIDAFNWEVPLSYCCEATDELQLTPLQKTPPKKNISILEQFRHQKRVAPALRTKSKKLRTAVPSDRSGEDRPPTPLEQSLKISRNSCYKSNPHIGRSE